MRAATHSPSERTLSAVLWLHRNEAPIDLMIRLGDQVYVDATAGLADPQLRDGGVGQAYRKWMEAPVASRVVSDIRQAPMLDDHEMCDNWSPVSPQSPSCLEDGRPADAKAYMDQLRDEGVQAFRTHQMTLGAGSDHATLYGICGTDALGRSVFMADTRSGRECRNMGNVGQAVIMPDAQAEAIEAWLHTSAGRGAWHFLASPSMVLPRLRRVAHAPTAAGALLSDAWDGFPASLHRLLWHIHATRTQRLVLLSGDAHLAHILRITLQEHTLDPQTETWRAHGDQTIVHGLHAPAMYSPFPFANARPADYSPDDFDIPHSDDPSRRLHCGLQTWFPTFGEGCFLLDIPHDASQALGVTLIHTGSTATMSPCPAWLTESRDLHVAVKTMTAIAPSS